MKSNPYVNTILLYTEHYNVNAFGKAKTMQQLFSCSFMTPFGNLAIVADNNYVYRVEFIDISLALQHLAQLETTYGTTLINQTNATLEHACEEISRYSTGELFTFTIPTAQDGSHFQKSIWKTLQAVPYGKTCSYKEVAGTAGNPLACRAAGNAVGANNLAIIIPCHRVVGANGLGGYRGGKERKRLLLEHEEKYSAKIQKSSQGL
jgi:AraC family transcriptional regulator of adaptative response/methylated-DNA-[protein]-cysteine methyltransferase